MAITVAGIVLAVRTVDASVASAGTRPFCRGSRGERPTSNGPFRGGRSDRVLVARLAYLMADDRIIAPVQLQPTQIEVDQQLLRDEDLLNEEHLRRMDQVLLRRNLDHARMFSRKLSLELQQFVHLYTPEANELRRRIEKYMVMERLIEREMARRHTY